MTVIERLGIQDLIERFELVAAAAPGKIAVVDRERFLTYAELNARADALAATLKDRLLGPGDVVGISLNMSIDTLISILGIWKIRAAFLPLDSDLPAARLEYMADVAEAKAVVTDRDGVDRLGTVDVAKLTFADLPASGRSAGVRELGLKGSAQDLAYVIYTSGTTGVPKGVAIGREAISNYVDWACSRYFEPDAASIVHSKLGFDFTLTELICPVLLGGTVYFLETDYGPLAWDQVKRVGPRLRTLKLTPSHLALLCSDLPKDIAEFGPRRLIVGGEELFRSAFGDLPDRLPDTEVVNEWGATEATVGSTNGCVRLRDLPDGSVTLGSPIQNTEVKALRPDLTECADGELGELAIGGAGVALRYLARGPNERFVQLPDGTGRYYMTGDYGSSSPGWGLAYNGRRDNQVKIKGYRVELGEVEAGLGRIDGVAQSAAVVVERSGRSELWAFLIRRDEDLPTPREIRSALATFLPHYEIPQQFVVLESMPLTANGKVDYTALRLRGEQRG